MVFRGSCMAYHVFDEFPSPPPSFALQLQAFLRISLILDILTF